MRSRSWAWSTLYQTREPHAYKSFELLTTGSKQKQSWIAIVTYLQLAKSYSANMHKSFGRKVTSLAGCMTFSIFSITVSKETLIQIPPPPLTKNKIKIAILIQYGRKKGTKIDNLFYKIEEKNSIVQNKIKLFTLLDWWLCTGIRSFRRSGTAGILFISLPMVHSSNWQLWSRPTSNQTLVSTIVTKLRFELTSIVATTVTSRTYKRSTVGQSTVTLVVFLVPSSRPI